MWEDPTHSGPGGVVRRSSLQTPNLNTTYFPQGFHYLDYPSGLAHLH